MKWLVLSAVAGLSFGLAQDYSLNVGGQAATQNAITVDGQVYVPLTALTDAGATATLSGNSLSLTFPATVASGGAEQVAALEGCIGTDFFNGVWRFKVLALEPLSDDPGYPGWALDVEARNGFQKTLQPVFTGFSADGEHMHLISPAGSPLELTTGDVLNGQKLSFAELPPGGVWQGRLTFHYPFGTAQDKAEKPVKLLFEVDPAGIASGLQNDGLAYSVPNPSFRVDLTCQE